MGVCPEERDQDGEIFQEAAEVTGFAHLEKRRLRGDPITVHSFLRGVSRGAAARLLSLVTSRTQGNGMKLHQRRFRLDSRKCCLMERVAGYWSRPSREVVGALNLSEFKDCLNDALRFTVMWSCEKQGVGLSGSYGYFPT